MGVIELEIGSGDKETDGQTGIGQEGLRERQRLRPKRRLRGREEPTKLMAC